MLSFPNIVNNQPIDPENLPKELISPLFFAIF